MMSADLRAQITSKLWGTYHSRVEECLDQTLANLGTSYLDRACFFFWFPPIARQLIFIYFEIPHLRFLRSIFHFLKFSALIGFLGFRAGFSQCI
jgi:hypothetical protein